MSVKYDRDNREFWETWNRQICKFFFCVQFWKCHWCRSLSSSSLILTLKAHSGKCLDIGCFGSRHQIWLQCWRVSISSFRAIWSYEPLIIKRTANNSFRLIFSRVLALLLSSSKTCTHFSTKQFRTNLFMSLNLASTTITPKFVKH